MNVIYQLWLRQVKRYWRSKARIVGSLGQPLLFMVAFGFGLGPIFQKSGQGNYINFLIPGIISMSILFTAIFNGLEIIWDRQFGFLKEMLVAPVSRLQIMFGRCLGGATVACLQGLIVLALSFLVGFRINNLWSIPGSFLFMFLISLLFTFLGTAIASLLRDMQGFQLIVNFLIMPIFFLSGALFPLDGLPAGIYWVIRFNPLAYGVDALRGTLVGLNHFSLLFDFSVMAILSLVFLVIASYLFSRIEA